MKLNYDNHGYSVVQHKMGTESQETAPHQTLNGRPDFTQGAHPM
jgi:hypothetical protein